MDAAWVGSSLQYSVPRYSMFGYSSIACSKPCCLWSVVEMPGFTLMTSTLPSSPICFARASPAGRLLDVVGGDLGQRDLFLLDSRVNQHYGYALD